MNETSSGLMVPRRNFIKMCAVAGGLTLFPWLAYASEADDLDAKADQLQENANAMQAQADEVAARLSALQDQYNAVSKRQSSALPNCRFNFPPVSRPCTSMEARTASSMS